MKRHTYRLYLFNTSSSPAAPDTKSCDGEVLILDLLFLAVKAVVVDDPAERCIKPRADPIIIVSTNKD